MKLLNPENVLFDSTSADSPSPSIQIQLNTERRRYIDHLRSSLRDQLPKCLLSKKEFLREVKRTSCGLRSAHINQLSAKRAKKIRKLKRGAAEDPADPNNLMGLEGEEAGALSDNDDQMEADLGNSAMAEREEMNEDSVFLSENEEILEGGMGNQDDL